MNKNSFEKSSVKKMEGGKRFQPNFVQKYSLPSLPIVTIITATYNADDQIDEAIKSIRSQEYENLEWIVIDGSSTDRTVEILRENEDIIDYWLSEPDGGIYDAFNKGVDLSRGEWVFFLGADDYLLNSTSIGSIFQGKKFENESIIYGNIQYEGANKPFLSKISQKTLLYNTVHHQGAFYNKSLFSQGWRYDVSYQLLADYELNLRIKLEKRSEIKLNTVISICGENGRSRNDLRTLLKETNSIRGKHLGYLSNKILSFLFALKVFSYYVRHK